jgi:hypothetical protein
MVVDMSFAPRSIFVAYPYELDSNGRYRTVFRELERLFDVKFVFANEKLTTKHILDKTGDLIADCEWSLFDISRWNANVTLELGLALRHGSGAIQIAFNPTDARPDAPSDIRGIDRLEYRSVDELRRRLHERLYELFPKGRVTGADPIAIRWNPRWKPSATVLKHAAVFDEFRVHFVPTPDDPQLMAVDVSCRIVGHGWRAPGYADAPWINLRFLDKSHTPIAVKSVVEERATTESGFINWLVADFHDGVNYRNQTLLLRFPPGSEVCTVEVQPSRGYALRSKWYRNLSLFVWPSLLGLVWSRVRRAIAAA